MSHDDHLAAIQRLVDHMHDENRENCGNLGIELSAHSVMEHAEALANLNEKLGDDRDTFAAALREVTAERDYHQTDAALVRRERDEWINRSATWRTERDALLACVKALQRMALNDCRWFDGGEEEMQELLAHIQAEHNVAHLFESEPSEV